MHGTDSLQFGLMGYVQSLQSPAQQQHTLAQHKCVQLLPLFTRWEKCLTLWVQVTQQVHALLYVT